MSTPAAMPRAVRRERALQPLLGRAGRGSGRWSTCATCRAGSAGRGRAAHRGGAAAHVVVGRLPEADARVDDQVARRRRRPDRRARGPRAGPRRPRAPRRRSAAPPGCASRAAARRRWPRARPARVGADPQTSLSRSAPAASAASATTALVVSMLSGTSGQGRADRGRTGMTRPISSRASTGAWPGRSTRRRCRAGRRPRRPSAAPARRPRRPGRPPPAAVAGERVGRDVEDAHHERPLAPGERRGPIRVGPGGASRRSCGRRWIAQERGRRQVRTDRPDQVERAGDDDRPAAPIARSTASTGSSTDASAVARPARRQRSASSSAASPARRHARRDDVAPSRAEAPSAHR